MRLRLNSIIHHPGLLLILLVCAACTVQPAPGPAPSIPPSATWAATASEQTSPAITSTPSEAVFTATAPAATQAAETEPSPTAESALPTLEPTPTAPAVPQLAFLRDGDIWLLDDPAGQAYQLTLAGDILSFAWSPDGERLAAFNGRALCFFQRDGSVRTACLELGLSDEQAEILRRIVWAPNERWIVLWNPTNPQDEGAIGWLVVALDTTNAMWRIQDPVDWGAELAPNNEPGGFTGQPLFLSDSTLIGTLSHRYLCGSGGCRYQLYRFDLAELAPSFSVYPNNPAEGWSEGRSLLLSPDGQVLTNFGAFLFGCDSFHTFIDRFHLLTEEREPYSLEQQAVENLAFHPAENLAILARTAGCSPAENEAWSQVCGLHSGAEVLPMQRWQPGSGETEDLPPGIAPDWSADGGWLAFRSCLAEGPDGSFTANAETQASIYIMMEGDGSVTLISEGEQPAWRPR